MDFIEGFPKLDGKNTILVVVDKLTKYVHFIPLSHPFTTKTVVQLFIDNIFKLHGLPLVIITDRDKIFTSQLWQELFKSLSVKLKFSSAYHPQTDSQSERVNQCLENYLRCLTF
jgi:transposase InsO family protein